MAYSGRVTVRFECGYCGRQLDGWFGHMVVEDMDDTIRCDCGRLYLVTRPYIIEADEAKERLGD